MAIQDTPFEDRPYPYQAHGTFLTPSQGAASPTEQAGGQGSSLMSAIGPMLGSMFAPNKGGDQAPPPAQGIPNQTNVPQYTLGPEGEGGEDLGDESRSFASGLGQGVLASSQAAAAEALKKQKKGMGGMGGAMGGGGGGDMGGFGGGFTGQV